MQKFKSAASIIFWPHTCWPWISGICTYRTFRACSFSKNSHACQNTMFIILRFWPTKLTHTISTYTIWKIFWAIIVFKAFRITGPCSFHSCKWTTNFTTFTTCTWVTVIILVVTNSYSKKKTYKNLDFHYVYMFY